MTPLRSAMLASLRGGSDARMESAEGCGKTVRRDVEVWGKWAFKLSLEHWVAGYSVTPRECSQMHWLAWIFLVSSLVAIETRALSGIVDGCMWRRCCA